VYTDPVLASCCCWACIICCSCSWRLHTSYTLTITIIVLSSHETFPRD